MCLERLCSVMREEAFFKQMVNGRAVTVRAVAHDSTTPGAADYISEKNHRVAHRPAEGKYLFPQRDAVGNPGRTRHCVQKPSHSRGWGKSIFLGF
jgi:hypothetical protein